MISAFFVFVLLFILTYFYNSFSLNALVLKLDTDHVIEQPLALIFSLALAPYITTLILYYLLWLFPFQSALLYVFIVIICFTVILVLSKSKVTTIRRFILSKFNFFDTNNKGAALILDNKFFKIYTNERIVLFTNLIPLSILLVVAFFWLKQIIGTPISGHDMLEYAIQAKHFAREKLIAYIPNRYHAENNFFYVGLHGFSFPLIGTWEYLFSEIFGIYDNDYLLRSVTGYYGILILVLIYHFIKKYSRFYALSAITLLFSSYGFYLMVTDYHIDTYRIFMILAAFAGLGLAIKHPSNITLILFGVFAAAQAYIHSLGVFIAIFLSLSFFIFYPAKFSKKAVQSLVLFFIIMLFGGVHYVMDVFLGTGWIFQEIKYY
ncbi:MAG: hypothetical protein ACK5P4_01595 [Bacteroidota bacterium]|jgi:hypothetical protein